VSLVFGAAALARLVFGAIALVFAMGIGVAGFWLPQHCVVEWLILPWHGSCFSGGILVVVTLLFFVATASLFSAALLFLPCH